MPLCLALQAMATRFELVLPGDEEVRLRVAGEEALQEIEHVEQQLSRFRSDSLLRHLEREGVARALRLDPLVFDLLVECRRIWETSDGAFDPTVGAWMERHGLHERGGPGPTGEQPCVGFERLELDEARGTVRLRDPDLRLDLGAVGKGHALDRAFDVLRDHGVSAALLHGGTSTVAALGAPPGADAWSVALRDPREPDQILATVHLRDEALSVSAQHGREVTRDGEVIGHALDPRSGQPATGSWLAAVVTRGPAAAADAWSTALLVLGKPPASWDDLDHAGLLLRGGAIQRFGARPEVFDISSATERTLEEVTR